MRALITKLDLARINYNNEVNFLKRRIFNRVKFEFEIIYQESDEFVILDTEHAKNAPLYLCLDIIEKKGVLTHDDYLQICI